MSAMTATIVPCAAQHTAARLHASRQQFSTRKQLARAFAFPSRPRSSTSPRSYIVAASSHGYLPRVHAAAVADAEQLMDVAGGVLGGGEARRLRFDVAMKNLDDEVHGAYGEFPLTGLLTLLEHPAVRSVLVAAEHGDIVAGAEGSIDDADKISRAAAFFQDCGDDPDELCVPEQTVNAFQPSLVDIGSGAGRLVLAAATMREWRSVVGIEACKTLAQLGEGAIKKLENDGVVPKGALKSIHADANLGGGEVECFFDASCPGVSPTPPPRHYSCLSVSSKINKHCA